MSVAAELGVVVELVRVVVLADEPVSRAGVVAALREGHALHLLEEREAARADVVVCVADDAGRAALLARQVLASGARRAVAVVGGLDDAALLSLLEAGVSGRDATPRRDALRRWRTRCARPARATGRCRRTCWVVCSATCSGWAARSWRHAGCPRPA